MEIWEHVQNAFHQFQQGETIGRRGTPVISFWPMREKWEKYGTAWATTGTDGDILTEAIEMPDGSPGTTIVIPAIMRLVYLRFGDTVCQLAYVLYAEAKGAKGAEAAVTRYNCARNSFPSEIS